MKRILNFLKRMILTVVAILILLTIGIFIFVRTSPQFGRPPAGEHLQRIAQSPNHVDGAFENLIETSMGSFGEMMATMPDMFFGKDQSPTDSLPVKFGPEEEAPDSICRITWYGHSAFLIEFDDKRVLIDPMLGPVAAPISFGSKRFPYKEPIPMDELTDIDAVILSHDHYDHLDYPSIMKLKDRVGHFYTALGVGAHLMYWGIEEERITELDWWESASFDSISLTACPARHFSGRGITDRNKTQWASWVIKSPDHNIYFSGDGGYGPHFKEIGDRFGPFDFAMLECGQYNEAWEAIHMMPEQTVSAGKDVKAKLSMPIHWGAFKLAAHSWTDPIDRFKQEAIAQKLPYVHPFIGESFVLGEDFPRHEWWKFNR